MRRKILCVVLFFAVCAMLCLPAYANAGTIRVHIGGPGEVTLYRVGVFEREHFRLSDEYGGGLVTFDDVLLPELAAWLAVRSSGGVTRTARDGVAVFSGLMEGLYLAVQEDGGNDPLLIILPWDGDTWNLDVKPERDGIPAEIPQTGDKSVVVISSWVMAAAMLGLLVIGSRKKY